MTLGKSQKCIVPDLVSKVGEDVPLCFYGPAFQLDGPQQQHSPVLITPHKDTKKFC